MFFFSSQSNGKPRVTNISKFFAEIELSNVFEILLRLFLPTYICRFYSEISQVSVKCMNVEKNYNIVTHNIMVHVISLHMCTYCRVISQNLYSALFIYILTSL